MEAEEHFCTLSSQLATVTRIPHLLNPRRQIELRSQSSTWHNLLWKEEAALKQRPWTIYEDPKKCLFQLKKLIFLSDFKTQLIQTEIFFKVSIMQHNCLFNSKVLYFKGLIFPRNLRHTSRTFRGCIFTITGISARNRCHLHLEKNFLWRSLLPQGVQTGSAISASLELGQLILLASFKEKKFLKT